MTGHKFVDDEMTFSNRKIVVGIATYKRPRSLNRTLYSVLQQDTMEEVALLVVDNDPERSAAEVCQAFQEEYGVPLKYVHEPIPGIAAARNRLLQEAATADYLLFIDDDEEATPSWLSLMMETQRSTGACLVAGPVKYRFDKPPPRWALLGGFYIPGGQNGAPSVTLAATNNMLVHMPGLARLGSPRFNLQLGLLGGSDSLFTTEIVNQGERIAWCEAAVIEAVPSIRTRPTWILKRAIRTGNTHGHVLIRTSRLGRSRTLLGGLLRVVLSSFRLPVAVLGMDRKHWSELLRTILRGAGMIQVSLGFSMREYSRSKTAVRK